MKIEEIFFNWPETVQSDLLSHFRTCKACLKRYDVIDGSVKEAINDLMQKLSVLNLRNKKAQAERLTLLQEFKQKNMSGLSDAVQRDISSLADCVLPINL